MKKHRQHVRVALLVALGLVAVVAAVRPSKASIGNVNKADLAGAWQMTTIGQTGCGFGTTLYTFTLNGSGVASNVVATSHTAGCGDSTSTGATFQIQALNGNGSGTAGLGCGTGCGWNLNIQVAPDRSTFSLIDVSAANPGNFIEGTAIHQ
jgi:hypothetical protein